MTEYLKINIDELDEVKKRYLEVQDELEIIEKHVTRLINKFSSENQSQTADKIVEIMETYEEIVRNNIDMFEQLHGSVEEYLDLVDDMLEPTSYEEVIIDFEELIACRNELRSEFEFPMYEIGGYLKIAEEVTEYNLNQLKRTLDTTTGDPNIDKTNDELQDTRFNLEVINDLKAKLSRILNFEHELNKIDKQIDNIENFMIEETGLELTHIEDTLNELEAFKLEVNIQALNALLPQEITSGIIDQVLGKLELTSRQQLTDKINELKQVGMFDNFYANVRTQVELMGLEAFLSDSERIKWLADNPEVRVGQFRSDLDPNQLRMLSEELPYILFSQNPETGELEFRAEFYDLLTYGSEDGYITIDTIFGEKSIYTDKFIGANLVFEQVNKPGTDEPWYIDEEGFQAVAMRVNGEIVIMYPGSQEVYADWIMTDLFPNLLHEVPEQYHAAGYFAAAVQAEYPEEEIILTGQSLAGGSVEYAGNVNDMMSFGIDPAPGKVIDPDGDKGITVIPGGKTEGLLNNIKSSDSGYNQSNTNVGILYPISILGGPTLMLSNLWGQSNDKPSEQELAYLNSISERDDLTAEEIGDIKALGPNDGKAMNTLLGEHFSGEIDDDFIYAYVPKGGK